MYDLKLINIFNVGAASTMIGSIVDYLPEAVGIIAGITIILVNIAGKRAKDAQKRLADTQEELAREQLKRLKSNDDNG